MFQIKKQINRLYLSSALENLSLTAAWVALAAARGYSLLEIGFAETVFHITSLIFEIPSGVLADVFGRKKMLIVSSIMQMIGNIIMICSCNLFMICMSLGFHALSYNFSSGSGDALAYDSLKTVSQEKYYEKYVSNQVILYRFCNGLSTLSVGFSFLIGYKAAYSIDILIVVLQMGVLKKLSEVKEYTYNRQRDRNVICSIGKAFADCFMTSLAFLKKETKAMVFMFCNSFVGAVDILLLFFLQAKLPEANMPDWALGFALFVMELGGIFGAKIILKWKKVRYWYLFTVTALLVLSGVLLEHSGIYLIMTAGGFLAALSDDALQVRTNAILQEMFPSEQRATLISMESFTFSIIMIVLSPLAGILFAYW